MAQFIETIELDNKVTPAAMSASQAVSGLGDALEVAQTQLVDTGSLGAGMFDDVIAGAREYATTLQGLSSVTGGMNLGVDTDSFDVMAKTSDEARNRVDLLTVALTDAQSAMSSAAAAGDMSAWETAFGDVERYTEALTRASEEQELLKNFELPTFEGKFLFDPSNFQAAKDLARQLADELESVEAQLLKTQVAGDSASFKSLTEQANALRESMKKLPEPTKKASGDMRDMWEKAADVAIVGKETVQAAVAGIKSAFTSLASGDVKGAIDGVTEAFAGMAQMLDLVVPGLGQAAAAVIKLTGGVATLAVSMAQFALEANEAQQATDGMFHALGAGKITGDEIGDMVDGLRAKLGVAGGAMEPFVAQFMRLGITGKAELEKLTEAAISMEAIVRGGGQAFATMIGKIQALGAAGGKVKMPFQSFQQQLATTGLSVNDLAKQLGVSTEDFIKDLNAGTLDAKKLGDAMQEAAIKKGAGPLATLANSAKNLGELLNEYLGELFEDLGDSIGPFMKEVKLLFGIFDSKTNPSGQALKAAIGGALKEIFAVATKVVPMVKHFLLDMVIYGLKAYIALKPIVKTMKEFFTTGEGAGPLKFILDGLVTTFKTVGAAILIVVGVIGAVVAVIITLNALIVAAVGKMLEFGSSITNFVVEAFKSLIDWVAGAPKMAEDFINGLIGGITGGIGKVVKSVTDLGNSALGAIKGVFDSHSPSKVMLSMGEDDIAGALATGMDTGSDDVYGVASDMASAAVTGVQQAAPAAAVSPAVAATAAAVGQGATGAGGTGTQIVFEAGAIVIQGAGKDFDTVTEEMWAQAAERLAQQAGAG